MKFFKTSESFFTPRSKKKKGYKIKNAIDKELQEQEATQILDEIALRASQTLNDIVGNQ